jgi:DNA polymerase-3 subunit beta
MKIVVDRNKLLEAFKSLLPIVHSSGSSLGITDNVKFEANGDMVLLTGTNLSIYLHVKVACEVKESGSTTLPLKRLNSLIKEMVKGEVTIDSADGDTSVIRCGSSKFKVNGLPAVEFPVCPTLDGKAYTSFYMSQDSLRKALKQGAYACGDDSNRIVLTGVLFEVADSKLNVVSTNGCLLAYDKTNINPELTLDKKEPKGSFIIPSIIKDCLMKTLMQMDTDIQIRFNNNCVFFNFGDIEMYTKVIDGTYPNYKQVIPSDFISTVVVEKQSAISVLRLVSVVSDDKVTPVSVCFNNGKMTVSCTSTAVGYAEASLDVDYTGSEIKISLSVDHLLSILESMDGVNVGIKLGDGFAPVKIMGEENSFAILMPMKLN